MDCVSLNSCIQYFQIIRMSEESPVQASLVFSRSLCGATGPYFLISFFKANKPPIVISE